MKIFVTGANGYIGSAVAAACSRGGHEVYGLVRSEEKGRHLAAMEVHPVVGSMQDPSSYVNAARLCQVLIHCAAEYSDQYMALDRKTADTLLTCAAETGRPRLFIYTSGVWIYGDTGDYMVDETTTLNPPDFLTLRAEHEKMVLDASRGGVRTLVVRPGCVYGGKGGLTAPWFESAVKQKKAKIVGDGLFRWAMVHRADLAELYLRLGESPWSGEVFNATDRSRFTVRECAQAASHAAGGNGSVESIPLEDAAKKLGPMAEALTLNQHVDSSKAARLLGWWPRHGGFVDGAPRYYAAWRAMAGEV